MMREFFRPDIYTEKYYEIEPVRLRRRGIRLLIMDLDNTLADPVTGDPEEHARAYVEALEKCGIRVVVMTNNFYRQARHVCESLKIDHISFALKPLRHSYERVLNKYGVKASETAAVGNSLFTDIYGANRMGIKTILVESSTQKEHLLGYPNRMLSGAVFRYLEMKEQMKKGEYYGKL